MSGGWGGTGQGNCHMGPTSPDTTENITFQQLRWRAVKIALCAIKIAQNGFMHEYLLFFACRCSSAYTGTFCETSSGESDNTTTLIIVLSVVGFIALLLVVLVISYVMRRRALRYR